MKYGALDSASTTCPHRLELPWLSPAVPFLQLHGVSKRYGGVGRSSAVDFACHAGAIHAVLGENGAGKRTLIKIIVGRRAAGRGRDRCWKASRCASPAPAKRRPPASSAIFQELSLIPDLSVADNICITNPPRRFGLIDRRAQRRTRRGAAGARRLRRHRSARAGRATCRCRGGRWSRSPRRSARKPQPADPRRGDLGADRRPTSSGSSRSCTAAGRGPGDPLHLAPHERDRGAGRHLLGVPQRPPRRDLRQGTRSDDEIVGMMIGRDIAQAIPPKPRRDAARRPPLPRGRAAWLGSDRLHDISLRVGKGEIVGLGGLDGQGQRELLLALFGVLRGVEGRSRSTASRPTRSAARRTPRAPASASRSCRKTARPRA